jgi:hypothetical protein
MNSFKNRWKKQKETTAIWVTTSDVARKKRVVCLFGKRENNKSVNLRIRIAIVPLRAYLTKAQPIIVGFGVVVVEVEARQRWVDDKIDEQ